MTPAGTAPRVLNLRSSGIKPSAPPPNAVYIGRATRAGWPQSKWANPFIVSRDGYPAEVVAKHRIWICDQPALLAALPELRGRDLLCWCKPAACHGDVLLRLAAEVMPAATP